MADVTPVVTECDKASDLNRDYRHCTGNWHARYTAWLGCRRWSYIKSYRKVNKKLMISNLPTLDFKQHSESSKVDDWFSQFICTLTAFRVLDKVESPNDHSLRWLVSFDHSLKKEVKHWIKVYCFDDELVRTNKHIPFRSIFIHYPID